MSFHLPSAGEEDQHRRRRLDHQFDVTTLMMQGAPVGARYSFVIMQTLEAGPAMLSVVSRHNLYMVVLTFPAKRDAHDVSIEMFSLEQARWLAREAQKDLLLRFLVGPEAMMITVEEYLNDLLTKCTINKGETLWLRP